MIQNKNIWLIAGDLGFGGVDEIRRDFPDRFINAGAAEQAMIGLAVGLTYEFKIPFVYSISPFLVYRPFETLRNYLHNEKAPVILCGSGRGKDYKHDGFSHWAHDVPYALGYLSNIKQYYPSNKLKVSDILDDIIQSKKPAFLSLER